MILGYAELLEIGTLGPLDPGHKQAANHQDEWLDDLDRRKFAGTELVALIDDDVQLEAARIRNFESSQERG